MNHYNLQETNQLVWKLSVSYSRKSRVEAIVYSGRPKAGIKDVLLTIHPSPPCVSILITVALHSGIWKPADSILSQECSRILTSFAFLLFLENHQNMENFSLFCYNFYSPTSGETTWAQKNIRNILTPRVVGFSFLQKHKHPRNCVNFNVRRVNQCWETTNKTPSTLASNSHNINFHLMSQTMACQ